ncbi:hypothetical protein [Methanoculleus oceani]|nr:hypothetical protein [Methanoculleus sp. CWC-02]
MNLGEKIVLALFLYLGAYAVLTYIGELWWFGLIMALFAILLTVKIVVDIFDNNPNTC